MTRRDALLVVCLVGLLVGAYRAGRADEAAAWAGVDGEIAPDPCPAYAAR